jgi:hypothetical protein
MHYFFKHPGFQVRNFARKMPGLDLRGDGGCVVAPPSIHANGTQYTWEVGLDDAPIADMPEWLLEFAHGGDDAPIVESDGSASMLTSSVRDELQKQLGILASANEGERNETLNRVAHELGRYVGAGRIPRATAEAELAKVATQIGLSEGEIKATIKSGLDAGIAKPKHGVDEVFEILDSAPDVMGRPLSLIGGKAYGATWLPIGAKEGDASSHQTACIIFDESGAYFAKQEIAGARPVDELPFVIELEHRPRQSHLLSPSGFRALIEGYRPNSASLFEQLCTSIDGFVHFHNSLADQSTMCELISCWVIGTYVQEGFNVQGYLWCAGERGSGKSKLLSTVSQLAFLGRTLTSGSSFASIRDEAHYGAMLGFDDCEDVRGLETNKRELLLAGNARGVEISHKVPTTDGNWETRYVNNFAPRAFSSIKLPDEVLQSRAIQIPMIRTTNNTKSRRSPLAPEDWAVDRQKLIDDIWIMAVTSLNGIKAADARAMAASSLEARDHDIWRLILAVAYWLQFEHGVDGVFDKLSDVSIAYTEQRSEGGVLDLHVLVLHALNELLSDQECRRKEIETAEVLRGVQAVGRWLEGASEIVDEATEQRVGMSLRSLGFKRSPSHGRKKSWIIDRRNLDRMANRFSVEPSEPNEAREERELEVLPF